MNTGTLTAMFAVPRPTDVGDAVTYFDVDLNVAVARRCQAVRGGQAADRRRAGVAGLCDGEVRPAVRVDLADAAPVLGCANAEVEAGIQYTGAV